MSLGRVLSLQAAVSGFHIYKALWVPKYSEVLACSHKENNPHDPFVIKICQLVSDKIVGHFPMELSRISKFIQDQGAKIEVKLQETHYDHSPFVQEGLEIPFDLVIGMPNTVKSAELLKKYLKLFENCYKEPQEIVMLGSFGSKSVEIIRGNEKNSPFRRKESTSRVPNSKSTGEKERKKRRGIVKSHDVKSMFKNAVNKRKALKKNEDESVVILDWSSLF